VVGSVWWCVELEDAGEGEDEEMGGVYGALLPFIEVVTSSMGWYEK